MADQHQEQFFFNLFDFYWFQHQIFNKNKTPSPQFHEIQESSVDKFQNLDFAINVRSYSDQLFLSSKQQSLITDSPNSVLNLQSPKLQTIFSGKKVGEFEEFEERKVKLPCQNHRKTEMKEKKRVWRRRRESKSMSELEFEELKGFMDLGFVFCEKDKSSSLVSIIPGLQRLGNGEFGDDDDDDDAPRPYLSEAWDVMENQRQIEEEKKEMVVEVPLMMISELEDDVKIKHKLKFWAHSVASAVR